MAALSPHEAWETDRPGPLLNMWELARLRAEKPLWGNRSSSPSLRHRHDCVIARTWLCVCAQYWVRDWESQLGSERKKTQWGKRSSSLSLLHRSDRAMRVRALRAVLVEELGELARLRAQKPQWGKTLLLAIIASSLGRGLYTHAHSVYVIGIASRTCTCTCVCT